MIIARVIPAASDKTAFARDEEGSFTILSLFLFFMMVLFLGVGVDVMRFEAKRSKIQATADAAVLAAANLDQTKSSEDIVRDYFEKSGLDPALVNVVVTTSSPDGGSTLTYRKVEAKTPVTLDTIFMGMSGVDTLGTSIASAAAEGYENVEVSLILDISGSMQGQKIADLKRAAKEFVGQVIDETRTVGATSISIVPYNHAVVTGAEFLARLNAAPAMIPVASPRPYPGALTRYPGDHTYSTCIRFRDSDFFPATSIGADYPSLRAIAPSQHLERIAHVSRYSVGHVQPQMAYYECDETRSPILVHESSVAKLRAHIDGLVAAGNTAIDLGMKWGVALLDPAMRPVVNGMIADGERPAALQNRPGDYGTDSSLKIVVLMTDGENTVQYDLQDAYKVGPTQVWWSEKASSNGPSSLFPVSGRSKRYADGYFVEVPGNTNSKRFRRVEDLGDYSDGTWFRPDQLPDDIRQLDRTELNHRLSLADWSNSMFYNIDNSQRTRERNSLNAYSSYGVSDSRLDSICSAAKQQNDILVFTIAFQAPTGGQTAMKKCATSESYYFDVNDVDISTAFNSIATTISKLRLTQ